MSRLARLVLGAFGAFLLMAAAVSPAAADGYGNHGGNVQLYQVTVSSNCNNASLCGGMLGGFWAWGVFDQDGTFDAELTFCGHLPTAGGGAEHFHVDGTYAIVNLNGTNWIVITSETDTAVGNGQSVTIPSEFMPVAPAAKAHLSASDVLGFSAPGVVFNITVTPMHAA
jgi:hypothetical protein